MELDHYRVIKTKCSEDTAVLKEYIEQDRVYDFLVGLNPEFDQARVQILGKPKVPCFNEVVAIVRSEESRRSLILDTLPIESSAMVAENIRDGQAKMEKKGDLWCTYCNKPRHTWEKCWKLHGRPPSREWCQKGGSSGSGGSYRRSGKAHIAAGQNEEKSECTGKPEFTSLNQEEIDGMRAFLNSLEKPSSTSNLAYSGRHGGTPLHHAAKRGLESIVKLLLSNGANPLVLNDDCQTALEVARAKKHTYVVRAIESHLCLFSGWLREFLGYRFLEVVAPQLVSRKVWVVVLPVRSWNLSRPYKLELAIYSTWQDAQPRTIFALWKTNLEPKLRQSDPTVTIVDTTDKTRVKLGPANENDKQQLARFSFACKGIPHANPVFLHNNVAMAMAIDASIQYAIRERPPFPDAHPSFEASSSSGGVNNTSQQGFLGTPNPNTSHNDSVHEAEQGGNSQHVQIHDNDNVSAGHTTSGLDFNPSAPPIGDEILIDGPIHYPSIDLSPVEVSSPVVEIEKLPKGEQDAGGSGSSCVICLDAPAEGACIPCGHVAGCMSCLNEVKTKKWGCPVCRAKIDQVIKIYHV